MKEFIESVLETKLVETIITIVISIVLYTIFKKLTIKGKKNKNLNNKLDNKQKTYIRLFNNILKYAFIIVTLLIVLQINGVNVNSMLAGVGILSVVIGLALQDALKDIIMGANIITDDFFALGDTIKYKGIEGRVVAFGLKTTKIQDLATDNIISITNRNIDQVEKVASVIYITIPISYDVKITKFESIVPKIVDKLEKIEHAGKCTYLGLGEFGDSSLDYKMEIECKPEYKFAVKRAALRIIKLELDDNDMRIPYSQIDVHNK